MKTLAPLTLVVLLGCAAGANTGKPSAASPASSAAPKSGSTTPAPGSPASPSSPPSPGASPSPSPAPSTPAPAPGKLGAPRLFYTDLTSGPGTGGENDQGVFVTLGGRGFGASQSTATVTVGGAPVAAVRAWSDTRIVFQLGAAAVSGDVVVHATSGDSNGLAFAVRPGRVFFVATTGDDTAAGTFASPWATIGHAVDSVQPGDSIYVQDGVSATTLHRYDSCASIEIAGTQAAPIALAAYPGATVNVGTTSLKIGLRVPNISVTGSFWVVSGLHLTGGISAIDLGGQGAVGWRIVGNELTAPTGTGYEAGFTTSYATQLAFYGNDVHDCGVGDTKYYHAIYISTDSNHVELAWNRVHDNKANRSIQFHSSPLTSTSGYNQYDLSVHDNVISGSMGDGINFATVDPSKGKVEAYNNVIYRVGLGGPASSEIHSLAGVYVAGLTNTGADGTGTVEVFNNTIVDVGSGLSPSGTAGTGGAFSRASGASPGLVMNLRNNLVYCVAGESYVASGTDASLVTGTSNLFSGAGAAPSGLLASISGDPLFASLASLDLHVQAGSPAVDAGVPTGIATDQDGAPRPQGAGYDVGAYER